MNILEVTTNIVGCTNHCLCCPQSTLLAAYKGWPMMLLRDFESILNNLPYDMELEFCGFSEPFLNPACSAMMERASVVGFHLRLLTTLTGFRRADIAPLQRSTVHYIRLHLPDTEQFVADEDKWMAQHRLFYEAAIPADYDYMAMGPVSEKLKAFLAGYGVTDIMQPRMNSRAGTASPVEPKTGLLYCLRTRWHHNILLPNGEVYLCCMDFGLKHRLGNLLEQPYAEIYAEGERLMVAKHEDMICARCEWAIPGHWYNFFGKPQL